MKSSKEGDCWRSILNAMPSQMFGNSPKLCSHYEKSAASLEDLNKYIL